MGIVTLGQLNAVIGCKSGTLRLPGPGGFTMNRSPGTESCHMVHDKSSHWYLPITKELEKSFPPKAGKGTMDSRLYIDRIPKPEFVMLNGKRIGVRRKPDH